MTLREANVPNAERPDPSKQPLRALIVEDSPGDVKLMVIALERAGYLLTCDVVESVALFQKRLSETQYDLILGMLGITNKMLAARLRGPLSISLVEFG